MDSLIQARSISMSETDPQFPSELARLAWAISDAMSVERKRRAKVTP